MWERQEGREKKREIETRVGQRERSRDETEKKADVGEREIRT